MASPGSIDLVPLERLLNDQLQSLRKSSDESSWLTVETTSKEVANNLRVRDSLVDHHTILGKTELPQTLTSLLSLALHGSPLPTDDRTGPITEILRAGANLCMDHDDNRSALLEVGFPQAVISLLEGYAETIPTPPDAKPLPLSIPHLKIVRTCIGVLLNASIGFDAVKFRLISLETALTIIKLSSVIYPPTSWTSYQGEAGFSEEWSLRSGISNWVWRTVSALKDIQDESLQIINSDVLPWIAPSLMKFCPPQPLEATSLADSNPELLDTLVGTDYDFLEETCTLIESLALDVEDFRLELARAACYPEKEGPIICLHALLQFIEHGSYPPIWNNPMYEESERRGKEKGFDICKAALIKAVVEVFGEEKNEDVLWKDDDPEHPGGSLVAKMVQWIKSYIDGLDSASAKAKESTINARDDMTICASLSLGNLARKATVAVTLLSPPYSLAPILSSPHLLSTSTDIKLKHGILGLLKHLAQFSKLSPVIPQTLGEVNILQKIAASGIWDEKSDAMANVIQLSAIGVAKHMCNGNLDQTFALLLPTDENNATAFSQILALIKRSDSISVKGEGSRVLVNVVKTLWLAERNLDPTHERQKKREQCITLVLTKECVGILTALIGRSSKYPILVNEGIVAITLLSTHKLGGPLVLEALTTPVNAVPINESSQTTLTHPGDEASNIKGSQDNDGLPVPRHALDMLIYALKNVDNPVNFPIEVRVNVCTCFIQLQRYTPPESLSHIREAVKPVAEQVVEDSQDEQGEEKLLKAATMLLNAFKPTPSPIA